MQRGNLWSPAPLPPPGWLGDSRLGVGKGGSLGDWPRGHTGSRLSPPAHGAFLAVCSLSLTSTSLNTPIPHLGKESCVPRVVSTNTCQQTLLRTVVLTLGARPGPYGTCSRPPPPPSPPRARREASCSGAAPDVIVRANLCSVYTGSRCHGLLCGFIQMPGKKGTGWGLTLQPTPARAPPLPPFPVWLWGQHPSLWPAGTHLPC